MLSQLLANPPLLEQNIGTTMMETSSMSVIFSQTTFSQTRLAIAALIILLTTATASLAEFRIATVDINKVINEISESKKEKEQLNSLSQNAKKEIEGKRDKLKTIEEKIRSGKIKEDSSEAEAFREQAREYSRFVQDKEETLKRKFMLLNKKLTTKALGAVEKYAAQEKIDLVLDTSAGARSPVLFGAETNDVTDEVIDEVNSSS